MTGSMVPLDVGRQARLATVISLVRQRWGDRALRSGMDLLSLSDANRLATLSTGSLGLDLLTGGLPRGALTEIAGRDGSGVELLGQTALARAQADGALVLLVDAEITTDPDSLAAVGIDHARLVLACPVTAPDAWGILEAVGRSDTVDLIVVSLLGLTSAPGATPSVLRWGLPRLARALRGRGTAVLLLSTPLHSMEPSHLPQPVPTIGGPTIGQAAAVRVLLTPTAPRLTPYGTIAALAARAAVVKCHGVPRSTLIPLEFTDRGVHRALECVTLGLLAGVVAQTSLGLAFDGRVLGRTPVKAAALLEGTPAVLDDLDRRICAAWMERHTRPASVSQSGVA